MHLLLFFKKIFERIFKLINQFIYFWLHWGFIAVQGLSLVEVHGLLIVMASLVAEHKL